MVFHLTMLLGTMGFLSTEVVQAQCPNAPPDPSWTITTCNSPSNHTITINPTFPNGFVNDIDSAGTMIAAGDYIGAFYINDSGLLTASGWEQWTGGAISFPVRGDDTAITPLIDGYAVGDDLTLIWYLWDSSASALVGPMEAKFHPSNFFGFGLVTDQNIYAVNGSSAIQSFSIGGCDAYGICTQENTCPTEITDISLTPPTTIYVPYNEPLTLPSITPNSNLLQTDIVIRDPQNPILVDTINQIYEPNIIGLVPITETSINPSDYNFEEGDQMCITAISYDINAFKAIVDAMNPGNPNTCCGLLEAVFLVPLCDNLSNEGIYTGSDVMNFEQIRIFFESIEESPVLINSFFELLESLNESFASNSDVLNFVCPGVLNGIPTCAVSSNTICYNLQGPLPNNTCPTDITDIVLPPPATPNVLYSDSLTLPNAAPHPSLIQTDIVITDPQNLVLVDSINQIYEPKIIGSAPISTSINPSDYNFEEGDQICLTVISYDIDVIKAMIDILNPVDSLSTCCQVLTGAIGEPFCTNLLDAGIYTGNDIMDFNQMLSFFESLEGGPISVNQLFNLLEGLNQMPIDNGPFLLDLICPGFLDPLPICATSSNTLCYNLNSPYCNFIEYLTDTIPENTYQASNSITANGTINPNDTTNFYAGNYIDLKPGFISTLDCQLTIEIIPCTQ